MIRYEVTNRDERDQQWRVEPYGDDIYLEPGDAMTVEYEHPVDLVIEVILFSGGLSELWVHGDLDRRNNLFPDDLKHNGDTVWPQANQ
ncbi:hypothetical protein [Nocardia sp. NPDC023988]|uniref:hypothetical protein n=1 Tax=unclassified Nocardia TaxID=2637762 RepID=UPI00340A5F1D